MAQSKASSAPAKNAPSKKEPGDAQSPAKAVHAHKMSSWITVVVVCIGTALLGVSLPAQSLVLAIVGGAVTLAGAVLGVVGGILDDAY